MAKEIQPREQSGFKIPTDVNNVLYQKTPWGILCIIIKPEDLWPETATPIPNDFHSEQDSNFTAGRLEEPFNEGFKIPVREDPTHIGKDIICAG